MPSAKPFGDASSASVGRQAILLVAGLCNGPRPRKSSSSNGLSKAVAGQLLGKAANSKGAPVPILAAFAERIAKALKEQMPPIAQLSKPELDADINR